MERRIAGALSPGHSVAAIGGMDTALEAFTAVIEGKYAGKIILFPQLHNLPLTSLKDLHQILPEVAAQLGEDLIWTNAAEEALIETLWEKPA
jgi:L-sorbose 1-phosphate reductase